MADYIIKLPKAEQNLDNWRTAISRRAATPADVEELRIGKAGPPAHTLLLTSQRHPLAPDDPRRHRQRPVLRKILRRAI
jgi:hypothetical protein